MPVNPNAAIEITAFRWVPEFAQGLVRDLREAMGVNDEGVSVALDLVDRLHATRLVLKRVASALQELPEPVRTEALRVLREE